MSQTVAYKLITGTAPNSASTALVGTAQSGLQKYDKIVATLASGGNSAGNLDVYLQRRDDQLGRWVDWVHFKQRTVGAAVTYTACFASGPYTGGAVPPAVGVDLVPALAADSYTGGPCGDQVRCIATSSGAGTGAAVNVSLACFYGGRSA